MVYVGDNPSKDFVNLTPLGVHTIRVLTGAHRMASAKPGWDATHRITRISALPSLLSRIQQSEVK